MKAGKVDKYDYRFIWIVSFVVLAMFATLAFSDTSIGGMGSYAFDRDSYCEGLLDSLKDPSISSEKKASIWEKYDSSCNIPLIQKP